MQALNGRPQSSSSARVSPAALKRIRDIYGSTVQTDSHSELLLKRLKEGQLTDATRRARTAVAPLAGDTATEVSGDANINGNLQKLRKRIRKLSQKIVEAEKGKLIKLYENPAKRAAGSATPPVDIVAELRKIRLEKDKEKTNATDDKKAARVKKRKKRKKAVEKERAHHSTSSSTVQSWDSLAFHSDLPKARKPDILRMIKDREGVDSDVDSVRNRKGPLVLSDKPPLPSREQTIADLAVSLHGLLGRKSQASSAKSSLTSLATIRSRRAALKPVEDPKGSQYAACLASLANVFSGSVVAKERAPPSVPEYLEKIKTSRVKQATRKKTSKKPADDAKVKRSASKDKPAGDEVKAAKPALKKAATSKKKPKKEHVLFAESPEVAGRKETTMTVKKALEDSTKPRRKKLRPKKEAASAPQPGGDASSQPTEPSPKKSAKARSKKRLSIDIPTPGIEAPPPLSKEAAGAATPPADARQACKKIQRKNTDTLVNLNAQMSNTLRESIAHLNEICMRVRSTLSDMERDEFKYNKKRRTSDMSSECGSNVDVATFSVISIHADASEPRFAENVEVEPIEVIKSIGKDDGLDRLLTTISMHGDDYSDGEAKNEKARRKRAKKAKRNAEEAPKEIVQPQPPPPPPDPPVHTPIERPQYHRVPIWDRKPPSVINDIQLMVKRQATRSQYKEFMRNLRRQSARTKSSVVVLQPSRTSLDSAAIKLATKQATQRVKEAIIDKTKTKLGRCLTCSSDRCTCGVVVENVAPSASAQKMQWIRTRSSAARRAIQAYDILDEITPKDVEPLQSEYPRKDHIFSERSATKIEDTLLYQLLYNESPQVLESLLRSSSASLPADRAPVLSSYRERERLRDEVKRPNLVSTAYQMYEKLELTNDRTANNNNTDSNNNNNNNNVAVNNQDNVDNVVVPPPPVEVPKPKMDPIRIMAERLRSPRTKQKRPEEIVPIDLFPPEVRKQTVAVPKKSPGKFGAVKVRAEPDIGDGEKTKPAKRAKKTKKSSQTAEKKRAKQRKKDLIKPKLKPYLMDATNLDLNRILTVMRVSVKSSTKIPTVEEMSKKDKRFPTRSMPKISEENRIKIASMSRREIIKKLAPYIFMDVQPRVITVMPVFTTKFSSDQPHPVSRLKIPKGATSPTMMSPRREAPKRRDHGDVSSAALRKFCNRCEQMQNLIVPSVPPTRVPKRMTLRQKSSSRAVASSKSPVAERKPSSAENVGDAAAKLTRKKLNEVKSLVNQNKDCFPKDLNRAIEDIEFKIVNVLSNPVCKHADAFIEIEEEIKSILTTMGSGGKSDKKTVQPTKSGLLKLKRDNPNRSNSVTSPSTSNVVTATKPATIKEKESTSKENLQPFQEEEQPKSSEQIELKNPEETKPENKPEDSERDQPKDPEEIKPDQIGELVTTTKYPIGPLNEDIEKAIQGLDALMSVGSTDVSRRESIVITEVSLTESVPSVNVECKEAMTTFCAQVDRAIQQINATQSTDVPDADDYLTPYMRAVKQYQESDRSQTLIEFLDKLTDLSQEAIVSKDASCPDDSEGITPIVVEQCCLVTDEDQEDELGKSEENLPSGRLSTILSVGKSSDNIDDKLYDDDDEEEEEILLPVQDVVSDDSKEFKDCEPPIFFAAVETPAPKNESVDNYCQATGLQDVGQQIDLDDEGKRALEETAKVSVSTAMHGKPDDAFVNSDMQTLSTSEVFDEIQEYVRNFHRKTVACGPIEEVRAEAFKREIVKLEFEHEKILLQDTQRNVSSSSGNDEPEDEEPSVDSLRDDDSKFYTDVSLNVNLPSTATSSYNPFDLLDNGTQVPSDDDHEWFVPTASADIQASAQSKDTSTNTAAAARAKKELCFNNFSASICSGADVTKPQLVNVSTETGEESATRTARAEKATSVDATSATIDVAESVSDSTHEDLPTIDQVRTDTCLAISAQDKKLTVTETLLAKNAISLDLISLFDATRKRTEATDHPVNTDGSASQLLQAISQFLAEADNGLRLQQQRQEEEEEEEREVNPPSVVERKEELVAIPVKTVGEFSPRYGILLNSVYGLIFTIVFLGLNMNYTC